MGGRKHLPSEEASALYDTLFDGVEKIDILGISGALTDSFSEVITMYENYNESALEKHVKYYIAAKYNVLYGHASCIAGKICRFSEPGEFLTLPTTLVGTVDEWNQIIKIEFLRYKRAIADGIRGCFIYRVEMLDFIEQLNSVLAQLSEECRKKLHIQEYKRFKLLPLRSNGLKFIPICGNVLSRIGALVKPLYGPFVARNGGKVEFTIENTKAYFTQDMFTLLSRPKLEALKSMNKWNLGMSFKTNGYQLSVTFQTKNYPMHGAETRLNGSKKLTGALKTFTHELDPGYNVQETLRYFVDPLEHMGVIDVGNTNPITIGKKVSDGKIQSESFRKCEYSHVSKRNKKNSKFAKMRDSSESFKAILEDYNNHVLCTSDIGVLHQCVRLRMIHHIEHDAFMNVKSYIKLRFEVQQAQERALFQVANWILAGGTTKVFSKEKCPQKHQLKIVVFSDCGVLSGLRGSSSGMPMKKLQRLMVKRSRHEGFFVYKVDESYTSKRSNCCPGNEMVNMMSSHGKKREKDRPPDPDNPKNLLPDKKRRKIHGLCFCPNCHTLWSRDVHAVGNIWDATVAKINGECRPWWLRRTMNNPKVSHGSSSGGITNIVDLTNPALGHVD